ncbi:MAG: cysteine hydrolase [Chloroflexia bacterium]|nr:cysteine hydrolase [Chloroflexia bacterium]
MRPDLLPATATLLLIDIQCGLDDPAYGPRNNPDAEANTARLLKQWRATGRPLVHIQHLSTSPTSPLRPGQDGVEIKPEVAPIPGERVVTKRVNCAFIGTDLEAMLRRDGATPLVIAGLTTNHCVETTARVAGDLGFSPIVVSDATAAHDRTGPDGTIWPAETIHAVTLTSINGEFAEIASTEDILERT